MNIIEKLDQLAEYQAQRDLLAMDKQAAIEKIMTPEIKAQLAAIDAEYAPVADAADANIAALTEEIKTEVLTSGATVKGQYFMAVYNKGRVSWDSKQLDGMMALVPGLAAARKVGEPSITLRKV